MALKITEVKGKKIGDSRLTDRRAGWLAGRD